ncbi:MAG: M23 family metallopeptidase [Ginsengibacter sp.]|jgi:murein DD-endopeptidase MepM/ murein hydrolase activator NlpD
MKQKKEKTTILFVNKNPQAFKPMQVSESLILHWRKYIAAVVFAFIGLIAAVVYLLSLQNDQLLKQSALSNKIHEMHKVISQVDTSAIKERFTKIDTELSDINHFLKARGIKPAVKPDEGGEADDDVLSDDEITSFYVKYLDRIGYDFSHTPLGMPYHGRITSTFGHRENPFGGNNVETHKGLDISGPLGSPVKAMAEGTVEFAGRRGGFGNCIMLKHANGFETLYGHLSKILVKVGDKIDIGETIGRIGSTGRSTGPHLHYEIHKNGQQINPQSFLTLN